MQQVAVAHRAYWLPLYSDGTGCMQPTECNLVCADALAVPVSIRAAGISGDGQFWLQLAALLI